MNRSDLMVQFGLSMNRMPADLNRYISVAPDKMIYDKSARSYVRGPDHAAQLLKPDARRYRAQLRSLADGVMDSDDTWIAVLPSYDATPTPTRGVNPMKLSTGFDAIRRSKAIEVKYQSLSGPEPTWRWTMHYASGFDGFRWHMRAFVKTNEVFKDFLLSLNLQTRSTEASDAMDAAASDRQEHIALEIGPHPELAENQKKVIALDYKMRGSKAPRKARRADTRSSVSGSTRFLWRDKPINRRLFCSIETSSSASTTPVKFCRNFHESV